jgi:hypothetical protein
MSRSASSISLRVLAAYRTSREAGADEWSACETALDVVRRAHPEASPDFANTVVADILREAYPPSRVTRRGQVEWPLSQAPRPSPGKPSADARL